MISFTALTTAPIQLRNHLVARGIITLQTVEGVANTPVAVLDGLEWLSVPNIIITTLSTGSVANGDFVPAVMDTRSVYLVKMVRAAEADQIQGLTQTTAPDANGHVTNLSLLVRTKWGVWVANNSTSDTLTSADGRTWPARKVGTTVWLTESDDFGTWQ